jgi:hypothetical protein
LLAQWLRGKSLGRSGRPAAACKGQPLSGEKPSPACKSLLEGSEKAAAQWELGRRFREFEAKI